MTSQIGWENVLVPTWWRHQMETFSALLALCVGNSPVPVNSPHKGQWHGALILSLISAWINDWVNNREAGDLRSHLGHYDVNVMNKGSAITRTNVDQVHWRIYASPVIGVFDVAWTVWVQPIHSADSSIKLSDHHTTQTQTSEVRWAARFSGHWVVTSMFA